MPVAEAGPFRISGTVPGLPRTVFFQLRSGNVAPGGASWTSASDVFAGTTVDAATYTWKVEATEGCWTNSACWTVSGVSDLSDVLGYPNSANSPAKFLDGTEAVVEVPAGTWRFQSLDLNANHLDVRFVGEGAGASQLHGNVWGAGSGSMWSGWRVVFDALTVIEENTIQLGYTRTENVVLRLENAAVLSLAGYQELYGTNTWIEAVGGSSLVWRNGDNDAAGLTMRNRGGGLRLEDSTANPPDFNFQRAKACGEQTVVLAGDSVFRVRRYGRIYSESEDPWTYGDLTLSYAVPADGWKAPGSAPVCATYARGNADNKLFAWRSSATGKKVVLAVDPQSPLVQSGRARTVQLLEWAAGIDAKNVELVQGATPAGRGFARLYYTYGWPSTRTAAESADEVPTGVAAEVTGLGGTLFTLRGDSRRRR